METSSLATQQIERFFNKIAQKYPEQEEISILTDIHIQVNQESGELRAYDDFYDSVISIMRQVARQIHTTLDNCGILKPYSFVLEDDDEANTAELYIADDDTIIADGNLMEGLNEDLELFLNNLMK